MARRLMREEVRTKLHESVRKISAQEGIESLTTRKITGGCGLSDPYLYQCYDGIPELLEAAFIEIDKKIADLLAAKFAATCFTSRDKSIFEGCCWELWQHYWNFLMEDGERTVFFWRFYQSGYYTAELDNKRNEYYVAWHKMLDDVITRHRLDQRANIRLMISTMVDCTLLCAVKVHKNRIEPDDNALNRKTVFNMVFAQIFALFDAERQNSAT